MSIGSSPFISHDPGGGVVSIASTWHSVTRDSGGGAVSIDYSSLSIACVQLTWGQEFTYSMDVHYVWKITMWQEVPLLAIESRLCQISL